MLVLAETIHQFSLVSLFCLMAIFYLYVPTHNVYAYIISNLLHTAVPSLPCEDSLATPES